MTLTRPDKLNAVSFDVNDGVIDGLMRAERDPEVRAVVLAGAGRRSRQATTCKREPTPRLPAHTAGTASWPPIGKSSEGSGRAAGP